MLVRNCSSWASPVGWNPDPVGSTPAPVWAAVGLKDWLKALLDCTPKGVLRLNELLDSCDGGNLWDPGFCLNTDPAPLGSGCWGWGWTWGCWLNPGKLALGLEITPNCWFWVTTCPLGNLTVWKFCLRPPLGTAAWGPGDGCDGAWGNPWGNWLN